MHFVSKTILEDDFCKQALKINTILYLVYTSSVKVYDVSNGNFSQVKIKNFYNIIKSSFIVDNSIILVFDGYLTILNRVLENSIEESKPGELKYEHYFDFSVECRSTGDYALKGQNSICLASYFGNILFYTINEMFIDPVNYNVNGSILDIKSCGNDYYSILYNIKGNIYIRIIKHVQGMIINKKEYNVKNAYISIPLEFGELLVFSEKKIYYFNFLKNTTQEYSVIGLMGDNSGMVVCYTYYGSVLKNSLIITTDNGHVFTGFFKNNFKIEYIGKIDICKDIVYFPEDMMVTVGFKSNISIYKFNNIFELKKTGFILLDAIETFNGTKTGLIFCSGNKKENLNGFDIQLSNSKELRFLRRKDNLKFVSKIDFESSDDNNSIVLFSNNHVLVQFGKYIYNFYYSVSGLVLNYKLELNDRVIEYFKLKNLDVLIKSNHVLVIQNNDTISTVENIFDLNLRNHTLETASDKQSGHDLNFEKEEFLNLRNHTLETGSDKQYSHVLKKYLFKSECISKNLNILSISSSNNLIIFTDNGIKKIKLGFIIKGLAINNQYAFILTGSHVLRVYSLEKGRYVFIQTFIQKVKSIYIFNEHLFILDEKVKKFKIHFDGSIDIIDVLPCDKTYKFAEGFAYLEDFLFDLEKNIFIKKTAVTRIKDKIISMEKNVLKIYKYAENNTIISKAINLSSNFIHLIKNKFIVENFENSYKITQKDKIDVIEEEGTVVCMDSDEYLAVLVNNHDNIKFVHLYKNFKILYKCEVFDSNLIETYQNEVLLAYKNNLMIYKIGIKKLLKKSIINVASEITKICKNNNYTAIGTKRNSIYIYENTKFLYNDPIPGNIIDILIFDNNKVVFSNVIGFVQILKIEKGEVICSGIFYLNDIPNQLIYKDNRIFVICYSGKIVMLKEICKKLFNTFKNIEDKIKQTKKIEYFSNYRRLNVIDKSFLMEIKSCDPSDIRALCEKTDLCYNEVFELINEI